MQVRRGALELVAAVAVAIAAGCGGGGGGGTTSLPVAPPPATNQPAPPPSSQPGPPGATPSVVPSGAPTSLPTGTPTLVPTTAPTNAPSVSPTTAPTPVVTPTAVPTASSASLYCTTPGAPQAVARQSFGMRAASAYLPRRPVQRSSQNYASGVLEVSYQRSMFAAHAAAAMRDIADAGASAKFRIDLPGENRVIEVVHVAAGSEESAIAHLRSSMLVRSVSRTALRYPLSTNAASAFTNDPYFNGFSPANTPPLYESPASPGQWDLHAICTANAWAYGKPNSTGTVHPNALGGTAPIAIIDTGADMTHPELRNRVVYSEADLNGVTTVGGVSDGDGHGTNVAGIAGASGNNGMGFTGVAYAAPLMIFKVFPDPPCGGGCNAQGSDIAMAILHAVQHGAKVINLSLGSSGADTAEASAVASAISSGVVVVAAAGNEQASTLDYPAADAGVIAVGASALDDSTNVLKITVASYSNYDASRPLTWGVVAPGGDPAGSSDSDLLHWIENIYTSESTGSSAFCAADRNDGGRSDCRVLIAGTSQAAPHVAGAVSLLLSVGASPGNVQNLLCATATPVSGGKGGCGQINVYKAMAAAVGDLSP